MAVQVGDQLREAMRGGALRAGERLPSSRGLATLLGVSRTVVTEAYQQLYAEGWLDGRHGSGTYVADIARSPNTRPAERESLHDHQTGEQRFQRRRKITGEGEVDLRPGRPWVRAHDTAAWRRAWRSAGDLLLNDYPDPYGHTELRGLLADHMRRARAVPVGSGNIMVTQGTGHGLDVLAATMLRPGDRAGVEEPGYRVARAVFAARGAEIVPCPVDDEGVIVERLPRGLKMLYTTPAHQFPLGGRLPIPRRERLVAWARRTGTLIIEDDYDAEFRYDVAPLPALYGLDPDRVALLGTLSKSFSPDVGLGWLLGPAPLLARIAERREELADRTSGPVQRAVTTLLQHGDIDRHLRRMRLEYARRRAAIVAELGALVSGDTAGLHVTIRLPAEIAPVAVEKAAARGVLVETLDHYHGAAPRYFGLVIGYGSASLTEVRRGCAVLRELLAELLPDALQ
ncbi:PLP-dependent aminotransferase family protein [Streptosporangiaceae bacterium NEAU-GS5]|nr:PLP-dependent aminotransferase family protein [Streptosporangiaceae bacterium NEAU-GS5]